jgi:FKBP-type peptidyl-prolyl cis-trans isomerase FklB
MKTIILTIFFTAGALVSQVSAQKLKTTMDSLSYSLGIVVAQNLQNQGFEGLDSKALAAGINDVMEGKDLKISMEEADQAIQAYAMKMQQEKATKANAEGAAFLEENKSREGVKVTETGLQYEVVSEGTGASPSETDRVTVHYTGMLIDGTVFDSSVQRGQPATFPVNGVIPGWVEALQMMKVGDKWKLFIPSELAYGARGAGDAIPPNAVLIFEVELLEIQ